MQTTHVVMTTLGDFFSRLALLFRASCVTHNRRRLVKSPGQKVPFSHGTSLTALWMFPIHFQRYLSEAPTPPVVTIFHPPNPSSP